MTLRLLSVALACASWLVHAAAGFDPAALSSGTSTFAHLPRWHSRNLPRLCGGAVGDDGSTEARLAALENLCATQAAEVVSLRGELDDLRNE